MSLCCALALANLRNVCKRLSMKHFAKWRCMMSVVAWGASLSVLSHWGLTRLLFLSATRWLVTTREQTSKAQFFQGSVDDTRIIQESPAFTLLTGGFPCQPYSRQGDLQGLSDHRGMILPAVLRCAWLLQTNALECAGNVLNFGDIQELLDSFVAKMQFNKV